MDHGVLCERASHLIRPSEKAEIRRWDRDIDRCFAELQPREQKASLATPRRLVSISPSRGSHHFSRLQPDSALLVVILVLRQFRLYRIWIREALLENIMSKEQSLSLPWAEIEKESVQADGSNSRKRALNNSKLISKQQRLG